MTLPPLSLNTGMLKSIADSRLQLIDLQRQLGTGKVATTYGGYDSTIRITSLSLRAEISATEGFQRSIDDALLRVKIAEQTITRFGDIAGLTKSDSFGNGFDLVNGTQTAVQRGAKTSMDEMLSLLNTDINGRYIFGGKNTDAPPVVSTSMILNGDGVRAGVTQLISERRDADLGANSLGRLTTGVAAPVVTISEDAAGHPFGFKLATISSGLDGVVVTNPAGSPAAETVTFGAPLPQDGQEITLSFNLPDGTQEDLVLRARSSGPLVQGEFLIGATANDTATNFESVLAVEIGRLAATSLEAASAVTASKSFFDGSPSSPPLRVVGPPFNAATTLAAGTAADTVIWYQGDDSAGSPRDSALARIDDNVVVAYGTRANEEGIRTTMQNLAVLASVTFTSGDANAEQRYSELTTRVGQTLGFTGGAQSPSDIIADLAIAQRSLNLTQDRHVLTLNLAQTLIAERENANLEEVSVQILNLQTRMQASLQTTALISKISLVNFI